jgi:hypothetical protein
MAKDAKKQLRKSPGGVATPKKKQKSSCSSLWAMSCRCILLTCLYIYQSKTNPIVGNVLAVAAKAMGLAKQHKNYDMGLAKWDEDYDNNE